MPNPYTDQELTTMLYNVQSTYCAEAFGYFDDSPNVIYCAKAHGRWPAVTNLIQGMAGAKGNDTKWCMQVYYSCVNSNVTSMCVGMMEFFAAAKMLERHILGSNDKWSFKGIEKKTRESLKKYDVRDISYKLVDPAVVLARNLWPNCILDQRITTPPNDIVIEKPALPVPAQKPLSSYLHRLYMALAYAYAGGKRPLGSVGTGHRIAAVLANGRGRVLAMAVNSKLRNASYHAEVNLVQAYCKHDASREENLFIYTTLKPCVMCATMIAYVLPNATVFFGQHDPGDWAKTGSLPGQTWRLAESNGLKPLWLYETGDSIRVDADKDKKDRLDIGGALEKVQDTLSERNNRPRVPITWALNDDDGRQAMVRAGAFIDRKLGLDRKLGRDDFVNPLGDDQSEKASRRQQVEKVAKYLQQLLPEPA